MLKRFLIAIAAATGLAASFNCEARGAYFRALQDTIPVVALDSAALAARADSIALAAFVDSLDKVFWTEIDTVTMPALDTFFMSYLDSMMRILPDSSDIKIAKKKVRKEMRDSLKKAKPRILATTAFTDSLYYGRILTWTADTRFNELSVQGLDTLFNEQFYDYPMYKKDVGATYLGTVGSPTQYWNFFKREEIYEAPAFNQYIGDSYTPDNIPQFNTKTPYTELAYWGTPFTYKKKEESEVHLLSTQNITPEFNFTLAFDQFGSKGMLNREVSDNRTAMVTANYLGKRYVMNAGYIAQTIKRQENGGIHDLSWIRDTVVDTKTIAVNLQNAESNLKRRTVFIDQSYAIPMNFFRKDADSLSVGEGTMAYLGHSGEFSIYKHKYTDNIEESDTFGRDFYFNQFNLNNVSSNDRMDVRRFENRFFIKLQPFAPDALISKINAGIGYQILQTYSFDPSDYLKGIGFDTQHNMYVYGGASGMFRKYIEWEADGDYYYAGYRMFDFDLNGKVRLSVYPNEGGIHLTGKFSTSLREPHPFQQKLITNHHKWENDFSKVSDTRIEGNLSIPDWKMEASFGYALIDNMMYYDTLSIIRQCGNPVSVMSASLRKDIRLWAFHFDNRILYQISSNEEVLPLPKLAFNLKYYVEFNVVKDVMKMQIGINSIFTTPYHLPAYAPDLGVFYNQTSEEFGNVPYCDAFVNVQWKRASVFVKYTNCFKDWPESDYFSAYGYIRPCRGFKVGIFWPFYTK